MARLPVLREPEHPWERQPGEGKAFHYFATYRDLGPERTLAKTAEAHGKATGWMEELSRKHAWVDRAAAYDSYLDRRRRDAHESEIEAMTRRHVIAGQAAQRLAIQRLRGDPDARDDAGNPRPVASLDPNRMDAADAARMLELGVKLERMARGMPTEMVRGAFTIHPSELQTWIRDIVELSLDFIPDDRRDAYMNAVYGLVEGKATR